MGRRGAVPPFNPSTPWVLILVPSQGACPVSSWRAAQESLKTMHPGVGIMKPGVGYKDNGV